jgi:hypothetical protein
VSYLSSSGGKGEVSATPFAVLFGTQVDADALAAGLDGIVRGVDRRTDGLWEVTLESSSDQKVVVRVLEAVRNVLGAEPSSSATVLLDGREYVMNGG